MKQLGGEVIAISVDEVVDAVAMRDDQALTFPVVYDADHKVTEDWGLFDLLGDGVAAPATFVIRTDGSIESALVGTNAVERPTTESILEVLASLAGMDRASMDASTSGQVDPETLSIGAPEVGELVPDFDLPTARGDNVSFSQYAGDKNVVFVFYRAWW